MSLTRPSPRALVAGSASVALIGLGLTAVPSGAAPASPHACETRHNNTYAKLLECVTLDGVLEHQEAFQQIADDNGDTRADQTPGYLASVDYVVDVLEDAGWDAEVVPFSYPGVDSAVVQHAPVSATHPVGTRILGTGEGTVTGRAVTSVNINLVPPRASDSGCDSGHFAGFPAGNIALI